MHSIIHLYIGIIAAVCKRVDGLSNEPGLASGTNLYPHQQNQHIMKLSATAALVASSTSSISSISSTSSTTTTSGAVLPTTSTTSLLPLAFDPLPLGSITPNGWLSDQMQLMANGLAGNEANFYNYVAQSSWTGGSQEYSDLNEGLPYWFNGLVPLAYSLDDATLKDQVNSVAAEVLSRQASDGWIGPETGTERNFWGRMPFLLGLTQLVEANSTWEATAVPAMHRFVELMNTMLADNYTGYIYHDGDEMGSGDFQWGQNRVQDMMISLMWLYENYPQNNSAIILQNLNYLYDQSINWEDWYNEAVYPTGPIDNYPESFANDNFPYMHGVNVGQGLKAVAVYRRFTHNDTNIQTALNGVQWTFQYHGAASGTILADEREEGLAPFAGSELCTAVEAMFSLSYLYQALGVNEYADRAELTAFNAMPAMLLPDYTAHQYMEQPNQPYSKELVNAPFWNVNTWGQTFGLEPNYPCCTVNHPQGWPKYLSNSYNTVGSNGIAHVLLGPSAMTTKLQSGDVNVQCNTNYPFSDTLTYTINAAGSFDFYVRVPGWTSGATVNGAAVSPDSQSGLSKVSVPAGKTSLTYKVPMKINTQARANDTIAVYYGPLLYALEVQSTNTSTIPKPWNNPSTFYPSSYAPSEFKDWQLFNTSAWNVAIDPSTLQFVAGNTESELPNPLFTLGGPPSYMTAQGCEIDWPLYLNSVPGYAPPSSSRSCQGSSYQVRLVPYASSKLHMAELPTLTLSH